jgi:UDP-3-O-[3-hydroxymyristoyl] glucosamine N-acyltransferase
MLARHVEGEVDGDSDLQISRVRPFNEATEGDITLAVDSRYLTRAGDTGASAVIVSVDAPCCPKDLLRVKNPKLAFAQVLHLLHPRKLSALGISEDACFGEECKVSSDVSIASMVSIGDRVTIGSKVSIGSGCCIGDDCHIGEGSLLHGNVTLYPGVHIQERVFLHSGCVIGADGFGYAAHDQGHFKIEQMGTVLIESDVEIGANSCVDRGTFGTTVIGKGTKIDNLVHVGHNCKIGQNTVIVGCVGISGSVQIGDRCLIAGQAGVGQHVTIGDDVKILQKSAVMKDIPPGKTVSGLYGRDHREELRIQAALRRLPQLLKDAVAPRSEAPRKPGAEDAWEGE